jgi:hypothetical protein
LKSPDGGGRNQVGVDRVGERVLHQAAPVQQDQRALAAEAAQVDRTRAFVALRARVELIGVAEHAVADRQ